MAREEKDYILTIWELIEIDFLYDWIVFKMYWMENLTTVILLFHFSDLNKPADCNTKLPFICEKYNVSSLEKYSPDSAAKIQCSGNWISFLNKVKRELLHCANDYCFHDGCMASDRMAIHQITSLRQPLHISISHLSQKSS